MAGRPIVIAHHLMWTLYGWWLPNDPRGSTSKTIRQDYLSELGELHEGRRRVQPAGKEIRRFYDEARLKLKHPLLSFGDREIETVGSVLGEVMTECSYTCYACAVMPDHVHVVIRKHRDQGEEMIGRVQALSRERLVEMGVRGQEHPTWTRGGWKVFLDHPDEVWRTIRYVEQNPVKMGRPVQCWDWIVPYDNWPLHEGHSEHSPYVKALKRVGRYP